MEYIPPNNINTQVPEGYCIDLTTCNTSAQVLDWLCHILSKPWCLKEDIGYLLEAIDELSGGLQSKMCPFGHGRKIDMKKRLTSKRNLKNEK